jgi:hypothetical protein
MNRFRHPVACAEILEQSVGAGNRVGIGLSFWSARPHRLAESFPELLKSVQIRALRQPYSYSVPSPHRLL